MPENNDKKKKADSVPNNNENTQFNDIDDEDDFDIIDDFSVNNDTSKKEFLPEKSEKEPIKEADSPLEKQDENTKAISARLKKIVIAVLSVIAGIFVIAYVCCILTVPSDTISNNVMINNLNAGGLTYDEALASIESTYMFENQTITLTCKGEHFTINGADIELAASPEETAQKAFSYGKSGNRLRDGLTAMRLLVSKKVIMPCAVLNADSLNAKLGEFGLQIYGMLTQNAIDITDNGAVITPGKTGFDYNTDISRQQVLDSLERDDFSEIPVTLNSCPPDAITVDYVDAAIYRDALDARYEVNGNEVTVVPEQIGRHCDKDEVKELIKKVHEGGETVTVPFSVTYPNVTAQQLEEKLFTANLGSYSTDYSSSTSNRAKNVARAASLINGAVVMPGAVFSFNDTVGDRTVENGFFTAKEYISGQSVDGIGGGTCQVSSTLYSAVLYADLGITARDNHMMSVGYMPLGQDATVAYGSVDFKFKNTSDYPIKISSVTDGGKITVTILGAAWEPERKVELKHTSTSADNGYTNVVSKRYVYSDGKCIAEESLGTSSYAPHT